MITSDHQRFLAYREGGHFQTEKWRP